MADVGLLALAKEYADKLFNKQEEYGELDGWSYCKKYNGVAECWINVSSSDIYDDGINEPTCFISKPLPFKFMSTPSIACSGCQLSVPTSYVAFVQATQDTVQAHMRIMHDDLETNPCSFSFCVIGRWK